MRRFILTALLALLVAGIRFGLQAENRALTEARFEGTEVSSAQADASSKDEGSGQSFSLPKFKGFGKNYAKSMALTAQDQPLMAACEENYKAQGISFPGKIALRDGCACTARYATNRVNASQYSDFISHHAMILTRQRMRDLAATPAAIKVAKKQNERIYTAVKAKSSMNGRAFDNLFRLAADINAVCSAPATYRPESLEKIAAMGHSAGGIEVSLRGKTHSLSASAK